MDEGIMFVVLTLLIIWFSVKVIQPVEASQKDGTHQQHYQTKGWCDENPLELCLLKTCYSDSICRGNLQIQFGQHRENCFVLRNAAQSLIDSKLVTQDELTDLCLTNSTHAAILLRIFPACPPGHIYDSSERSCRCNIEGFCMSDILRHSQERLGGVFLLWMLILFFLLLVSLAFYQTFKVSLLDG